MRLIPVLPLYCSLILDVPQAHTQDLMMSYITLEGVGHFIASALPQTEPASNVLCAWQPGAIYIEGSVLNQFLQKGEPRGCNRAAFRCVWFVPQIILENLNSLPTIKSWDI